jgi:hypothetical protein
MPRTPIFAIALGGLCACNECPPANQSVTDNLGIDSDLHAVIDLDDWIEDQHYDSLAVGASGTVVIWGYDYQRKHWVPVVDVFDVGDSDLRAAAIDEANSAWGILEAWWVVGDDGTMMVTRNAGATWDVVDLPTDADLYGIARFQDQLIVIGDDVILMRVGEGEWTTVVPPSGGWGLLRGVSATTRVEVVGLGGVIWSTTSESGWTSEVSGVTTDLFAVHDGSAVGAEGTVLRYEEGNGWTRTETDIVDDLIDIEYRHVLGANGNVYQVSWISAPFDTFEPSGPLTLIDTDPGARGLSSGPFTDWTTVGDGGSASSVPIDACQN